MRLCRNLLQSCYFMLATDRREKEGKKARRWIPMPVAEGELCCFGCWGTLTMSDNGIYSCSIWWSFYCRTVGLNAFLSGYTGVCVEIWLNDEYKIDSLISLMSLYSTLRTRPLSCAYVRKATNIFLPLPEAGLWEWTVVKCLAQPKLSYYHKITGQSRTYFKNVVAFHLVAVQLAVGQLSTRERRKSMARGGKQGGVFRYLQREMS
jgi:hypothetical protein